MPLPISELALVEPVPKEPFWTTPEPDGTITQAIAKFKDLPPVEWTWDKFKGKCKDPIRQSGKQLWTNIVTAMRDAGIGEVTKSKPLTFRRRTDVDGHRKMSA